MDVTRGCCEIDFLSDQKFKTQRHSTYIHIKERGAANTDKEYRINKWTIELFCLDWLFYESLMWFKVSLHEHGQLYFNIVTVGVLNINMFIQSFIFSQVTASYFQFVLKLFQEG